MVCSCDCVTAGLTRLPGAGEHASQAPLHSPRARFTDITSVYVDVNVDSRVFVMSFALKRLRALVMSFTVKTA